MEVPAISVSDHAMQRYRERIGMASDAAILAVLGGEAGASRHNSARAWCGSWAGASCWNTGPATSW